MWFLLRSCVNSTTLEHTLTHDIRVINGPVDVFSILRYPLARRIIKLQVVVQCDITDIL